MNTYLKEKKIAFYYIKNFFLIAKTPHLMNTKNKNTTSYALTLLNLIANNVLLKKIIVYINNNATP
jgi:hypothetical protein